MHSKSMKYDAKVSILTPRSQFSVKGSLGVNMHRFMYFHLFIILVLFAVCLVRMYLA